MNLQLWEGDYVYMYMPRSDTGNASCSLGNQQVEDFFVLELTAM